MGNRRTFAVATLLLAASVVACGCSSSSARGTEGHECHANKTCNPGLTCFSNLCVRYDGGSQAGTTGGGGRAGGGNSGQAGMAGSSGAGGQAGGDAGGDAGSVGSAGSSGGSSAGTTGSGGVGGTTGAGGQSGATSAGGNVGQAGNAGNNGSGGQAGAAGRGGTGGQAGTASGGNGGQAGAAPVCRVGVPTMACDDRTPLICASGTLLPRSEGMCCGGRPFCVTGSCAACPPGGATRCVLGTTGLVTQSCSDPSWVSVGTAPSAAACGATCGSMPTSPAPASCAGGGPGAGANCGKSGQESCCASPLVPCGVSNRPAVVSDFRLDKYEITIGRFRAFLQAGKRSSTAAPAAGAGANPHIPGSGWDPAWNHFLDELPLEGRQLWTAAPGANENIPMPMAWHEAFAFCVWDGGRLPTEAEWIHAATGGDEQRLYPWGNAPWNDDVSLAVGGCRYDGDPGSCTDADVAPVGSAPAGIARWGQADLAGNAIEWVLDLYAEVFESPCLDCAQLQCGVGGLRINRGGSQTDSTLLRNTERHFDAPASPVGARCARAP